MILTLYYNLACAFARVFTKSTKYFCTKILYEFILVEMWENTTHYLWFCDFDYTYISPSMAPTDDFVSQLYISQLLRLLLILLNGHCAFYWYYIVILLYGHRAYMWCVSLDSLSIFVNELYTCFINRRQLVCLLCLLLICT